MKILILYRDTTNRWGGTERVLASFVRLFKEVGHYVKVISFDGSWDESFMGIKPDEIEGIKLNRLIYLSKNYRIIRKAIGLKSLLYICLFWHKSLDHVVDSAYNDMKGSPDIAH
ncbi:MAG: hypothetical protein ACP5I3_11565 [Thermoproteus sp.]